MANGFNENENRETIANNYIDPNIDTPNNHDFMEETAAEVTTPISTPINKPVRRDNTLQNKDAVTGNGIGWLALALSIISLFVWPVILGAAGIIVGFIARRRGAEGLGAWAIGIGVVSIIIGIFIVPFV